MRSAPDPLPQSMARRAAAIARGPHPCPSCEAPTWAEPPVPWTDLRDYVVRCDACDRPISVRIDRELVLRPDHAGRQLRALPQMLDPAEELLDARGTRAVRRRLLIAAIGPTVVAAVAVRAGLAPSVAFAAACVAIVPSCMWLPSIAALAWTRARARRWRRRPPAPPTAPVRLERGRWDQWHREERRRHRELDAHPEAVLRELERVLDERELRRVRMLAEHGEVPVAHLHDLLRHRRAWHATVA